MGGVGPLDRPDPQEHPEGRIDPMDRSAPMEEEARAPKVLRSPTSPTAEEIEEHEAIGHAIHRTWCGHCIRARGLHEQRKATPSRDDRGLPTVSLDYFYFGGEGRGTEGELPNLQVKDESTGMLWASTIPAKGADAFTTNFVLSCLDEMGYRRIILKSDNEVSIKALKDSIKAAAKTELSLEEGKTGDKPSTGSVESAVKETKRQCRAMKSALEEKLGKSIPDRHAIWTWLARHACFLISRYRVGPDGRTPYERLKGKRWRRPLVVFGERVHFRPLQSYVSGRSDLAPKLDMGVYVGTHGRNGDALVMTKEGVIKGGSLKRLTVEERWADVELFRGTPWKMRPKSEEDVEAAAVRIELPAAEGRLMPEPVARDSGPRNLYVTRRDVEGNYTAGCPGCIAIQVGLPARAHSTECRTLVQNRLMATDEGKERVAKAQKRKEGGAAPKVVLADMPDEAEEMHASDAVGQPEERVDPVGQPVPGSGTGRIDPFDRSTPPVSRAAEGATGDESPTKKGRHATVKKAKVQTTRGSKRGGGDLDDLYGSEPPREGEIELERGPSSSSKGEAAVASPAKEQEEKVDKSPMPAPVRQLVIETICNLELASFLNEKMFPEASFAECKNVSREMLHLGASIGHMSLRYIIQNVSLRGQTNLVSAPDLQLTWSCRSPMESIGTFRRRPMSKK